jgi:hypothetical protein
MVDVSKFYVPIGLIKDFAKEFGVDNNESKKRIAERALEIMAMYDDGGSLIYWTRFDRAALNAIFSNHLCDRETKNTMLRALASCDEVLLKLRDIACFTVTCESKAKFIVKISAFVERLAPSDIELLVDCVETLRLWSKNGTPEKPSENDYFLLEVHEAAKDAVPDAVDVDLKSEYLEDRFDKLLRLINKLVETAATSASTK